MVDARKLVFYGAVSLDGYLARENDSLDWLFRTEGDGADNGYGDFYATVNTILMGRRTYDWILQHGEFPYTGKQSYVLTQSRSGTDENVEFVNEDIVRFTKSLKAKAGGRIWMVGGGQTLQPLLYENLVDELILQIAPVIIGGGIPLFIAGELDLDFSLVDIKRYNQFAELRYEHK